MNGKELQKEFGDYQTPYLFTKDICEILRDNEKVDPDIVIEPTSGIGNFINRALEVFTNIKEIYGIEINSEYCQICRDRIKDRRLHIINDNFFTYNIENIIKNEKTLIIGNPPWATNSELKFNLPNKNNFKQLNGTDAITGASNFDICEYIILKLIEKSVGKDVSIAMLCKTTVARNILLEIERKRRSVKCVKIYNFNASKIFNINAAACLLYIKMDKEKKEHINVCDVYEIDSPTERVNRISFKDGKLKSMNNDVNDLEGICSLEWRQGVKHDCAKIMELEKIDEAIFMNKKKEQIKLEQTLVYPLVKSSFLKKSIIKEKFKKYVIVTQKKPREKTDYIREIAPLTWNYLCENKNLFDSRKSTIYKGAPAFSMFGIGSYSYSKYKVGVSGFYKKPLFVLLYNQQNIEHPVMLDDTTYFLSFDDYQLAYTCMLLLNTKKVQQFLYSISFQDAKRPYTKKVLQRLDLKKCIAQINFFELLETENELELQKKITKSMYNDFKKYVIHSYEL